MPLTPAALLAKAFAFDPPVTVKALLAAVTGPSLVTFARPLAITLTWPLIVLLTRLRKVTVTPDWLMSPVTVPSLLLNSFSLAVWIMLPVNEAWLIKRAESDLGVPAASPRILAA